MPSLRAQGATQSRCASTYCPQLGQGATEYLVLLAVVLIVALVSVALLGFFPGMASDAQATQSQAYWQSASPIAITEWNAFYSVGNAATMPYFSVRNNGAYPIRITGIVGADGGKATTYWSNAMCGLPSSGTYNMSSVYYMGPGEEAYFGMVAGLACNRQIFVFTGGSGNYNIGGASAQCANSVSSPGTLSLPSMGFEYIEYIEGQQITKRQIGKPVIIKCMPAT